MILAAVDDLLFSSKIRTTAKLAGVELTFARTPPEILDRARALRPALVIFDLNSTKANPIDTVTAMKRDPDLASIRTLGFVSHVHTGLIDAARGAGIDEVMARSAFAGQLADILRAASTPLGTGPSTPLGTGPSTPLGTGPSTPLGTGPEQP